MDKILGDKKDTGKPDYTLVPCEAIQRLAPRYNWSRFADLVFLVTDDSQEADKAGRAWADLIDALIDDTGRAKASSKQRSGERRHVWDRVVAVLQFGVEKYGRNNWQHVPDAKRRYRAAARQHAVAMLCDGPYACDEESLLPHWAHALACLMFLAWFDRNPEVEST